MAARLNATVRQGGGRRRLAALGLVVGVVAIHGCLAEAVGDLESDLRAKAQLPARIEVAYVREMALEAPPAPAAGRLVRPAEPKRVKTVEQAASAPDVAEVTEAVPKPSPEAVNEAASEVATAAGNEAPKEPAKEASAAASSAELALAASGPLAAASSPAGAASGVPFDWPESTRLSYTLTGNYQGEIHGSAQVEWIRVGSRYQVHLDVTVGLAIAPLMTRRMSSQGDITEAGLAPSRYDQYTRLAFNEPRSATLHFEPAEVVLANGQRTERWPGVQDTASQFVQLTWLFGTQPERLRTGKSVEIPLALPRKIDLWAYDVLEEETLYTPFGAVQAVHLKPRREARAGGDMTAEIWFAPHLRHLPVRIRIHQDAETFVDLMISRRPQLAAR